MDPNPGAKIRVLIIDDSLIVRGILRTSLASHPRIEVVGMAVDGEDGLSKIQSLRPDVVTLDVEMPKVNGIQVLERVGGKLPVAFVMCSTLTKAGASVTLEALSKGAFDYVAKPSNGGFAGNAEFRTELHTKVLAAAASRGRVRTIHRTNIVKSSAPQLPPNKARGWVVAIGISCGGPQTLHQFLPAFPSDFVPIVITQHMPAAFTESFAQRLNADCAMRVKQAEDGEVLQNGTILIAPGSHHLKLVRAGIDLKVRLDDGPKVSGHRPSADAMFASLALSGAGRVVGVVMTGMGHDGAEGIRALSSSGAWTLAQDEASCLVYGMPKAAAATGVLDEVVSLEALPGRISHCIQRGMRPASVGAGRD